MQRNNVMESAAHDIYFTKKKSTARLYLIGEPHMIFILQKKNTSRLYLIGELNFCLHDQDFIHARSRPPP